MNYSNGLGTFLATETPEIPSFEFSIYPNPVSNTINVKEENVNKISQLQIYDIAGKLILEQEKPFRYINSLDVSQLAPGVYIIKLDGVSSKFIKN